jgi:8-oxo-dGTP pyrophosphatase MutT (NUDIX family)
MNLFINDIFVQVTSYRKQPGFQSFDKIINARQGIYDFESLFGRVLLLDASPEDSKELIIKLDKYKKGALKHIVLMTEDKIKVKEKIKSAFKVIKAAGGVVIAPQGWLMMYRRKKWDLPKGKIDAGENKKAAALREVKEECNVEVMLKDKLCVTWHNYRENGQMVLKKTTWYLMEALHTADMRPQAEEDIEKLVWMDAAQRQEIQPVLFASIRFVLEACEKVLQNNEQLRDQFNLEA